MPRYRLTIEYDGRGFVGWQRQDNGPSVQAAVENALRGFCGETVAIVAAGRTDAGVHALGQVAHVDLVRDWNPATVRDAVNFHLKPAAVAVLSADRVSDHFHARFSARQRSYLYRILNRPAPPVLDRGRAWWVPAPLDSARMADAADTLIGRHDFSSFRSSICQARSPVRTMDALTVERHDEYILIRARARSFLHHQVRVITGTLKLAGEGKWTTADVRAALAAQDRRRSGPTAPAAGLYLAGVAYGPDGAIGTGDPASIETACDGIDDQAEGDVGRHDADGG
jgi:tRNA pseudouridine38-40 synthase